MRSPHQQPRYGQPAFEQSADPTATPIYDALYAEYRRLLRALPGDRSGEEELRFVGFDTISGTGAARWPAAGAPHRQTIRQSTPPERAREHTPRPHRGVQAALPPARRGSAVPGLVGLSQGL